MPTLRNRVTKFLLGPQVKQIELMANMMQETYQRLPAALQSPEMIAKTFKEMDPHMLDMMLRMQQSAMIYPTVSDEASRIATVNESRSLYMWDVVTQNIIDLWTDYGFGSKLELKSLDERAQKILDAFFTAEQNQYILGQRQLADLSTQLLTDGEFYFVIYVGKGKGSIPTIRTIPTEQIKEVITNPDDAKVPLFYKRVWSDVGGSQTTLYYRDWRVGSDDEGAVAKVLAAKPEIATSRAENKSKDAAEESAKAKGHKVTAKELEAYATDVFVLPVTFRAQNLRGWPLMTAGAPWSRAYKNFLQDRAAVSKAVAMFVDKIKVKGGSIALNDMMGRLNSSLTTGSGNLETNPAPVAGSTWGENESLDRSRMPLTTGAGDAEKDGAPLLAMAGLAGRVFSHYLGRGEAYRLATATAMEQPVLRAFNRYRRFWDSVWQDVAIIALNSAGYDGDKSIIVVSDPLIQMDVEAISTFTSSVTELYDRQAVTPDQMESVANVIMGAGLRAIGVTDVGSVLEPKKPSGEKSKPRVSKVSEVKVSKEKRIAFHRSIADLLEDK